MVTRMTVVYSKNMNEGGRDDEEETSGDDARGGLQGCERPMLNKGAKIQKA